jgi:hypothetical protein
MRKQDKKIIEEGLAKIVETFDDIKGKLDLSEDCQIGDFNDRLRLSYYQLPTHQEIIMYNYDKSGIKHRVKIEVEQSPYKK